MSSNEQLPSMAVRRFSTLLEDEEERQLEAKVDKNLDRFHQSRWGIWMDFAETTTLHGPIHITATKGKLRIYYIIVVAMMAGMFFAHAGYLFKQYLSFPVLTEIKYGNIDFTYPDITICPNAPFTDTEIAENAKLHAALNSTIKFWTEARRVKFGSPTAHAKRSFLSTFYRWSHEIGKKPYQHVLECQLKKEECMMNFIITEHPIYYRCFTLRVETKPPVPSGPTNGLRLILHRGQPGANPLLLVVEEEPVILQSVTTKEAFRAKDGFFITFHERGTFPNFPVQHLPNGLSLRFGEAVRVGLDQVHYKAVNITGRMCINGDFAPQIELFRLDKLSESNAKPIEITKSMAKFSYTRQACVAVLRQRLTYTKCKCFSESYAIPYSMRDVGEVWCHSLDTSTINIIRIGETLECAERIANMTDIQIVKAVRPSSDGDGLPGCPLRCDRRMISIHSSLQTKLIQSLDPKILIPYFETIELHHSMQKKEIFIKQDGPRIDPKDLIFLDIHPVTEMVNQLIENPGYTATKFVSDLGGISGLYVGITVYTLAELVDLVTQFLGVYVPYVWSAAKLGMVRKKNLAARLKRRMTVRSIYGATSGADHVSANTTTTTTHNVNSQSCLEPSVNTV
ncbi:hypothetical protein CSKR_100445 [Clonorchis sinensis]|uniref:FMRFamide-activated amiloride-sensitive sodium channel n=1 Tax=Clonorchis sinensis TaxID=79923 RepID=A0A8T1MTC2_CLOSI|nr:hypothetical protein CSKR_100445 [Clonorchis sinensis]